MNLKQIAQKIALTAIASITGTADSIPVKANNLDALPVNFHNSKEKKPVLILKQPMLDFNKFESNPDSHRSHRSHSSHRSHYSSRSSSTYKKKPTKSSSSYSTPRTNTYSTPNTSTYSSPKSKTNDFYTPSRSNVNSEYVLGSRMIKYGNSGNDVKELNQLLINKGYLKSNRAEGYFSDKTLGAVIDIQLENNIDADGKVNTLTLYYIRNSNIKTKKSISPQNNYSTPTPNYLPHSLGDRTLRMGVSGNDVLELKSKLVKLGLLSYDSESNYFDNTVKEAVKKFQRQYGLTADGIAGRRTLRVLIDYRPSSSIKNYNSNSQNFEGKEFTVSQSTSLRSYADSKASVIDRVRAGESVVVINTDSFAHWWKVSHDGKIGWMKKHLLQK